METDNIIILTIAGFTIKIDLTRIGWSFSQMYLRDTFMKYYGPFISQTKPSSIDYEIVFVFDPRANSLFFNKTNSKYFFAYKKVGKRKLLCSHRLSPIHIELVFRHMLQYLLSGRGFILHSSAAEIRGRADVFVGPGGAGKSTAINLLSKRFTPFCDDTSIITKSGKTFSASTTPFFEPKNPIEKIYRSLHIHRVFFLRKSTECKIEKIDNLRYISERLINQTNIMFKNTNLEPGLMAKHTKTVLDFAASFGNFYFLYFTKSEVDLLRLFRT